MFQFCTVQAILYRSRVINCLADPLEREQLAIRSADHNTSAEISGFMLYREGQFMQYIEGEQAPLNALFSEICNDPRHDVRVHLKQSFTARRFPNWQMKLDPEESLDEMVLDSLWNMLTAAVLGVTTDGVWATLDSYSRYTCLKL